MLNAIMNRIIFSVMLVTYVFLSPSLQAHDEFSDELIVEDGYLWFPQGYHTNSAVITNSTGNLAVDQCELWHTDQNAIGFLALEEVEVGDDEPFTITVDKNFIENYLASVARRDQIKEGLYEILETTSDSGDNYINVGINSFLKIRINKNSVNCPDGTCGVAPSSIEDECRKKLKKLPMHYFSNEQTFMLTEAIYPKTIVINPGDDEVEVETTVNLDSVKINPFFIESGIMPLAARIQYIFDYKDNDDHTGTGSETVRLRSIPIKRKPKQEKIRMYSGGR